MYIVLCVKCPMILDVALAYLRGGYCPEAHAHIGVDRSKRKTLDPRTPTRETTTYSERDILVTFDFKSAF